MMILNVKLVLITSVVVILLHYVNGRVIYRDVNSVIENNIYVGRCRSECMQTHIDSMDYNSNLETNQEICADARINRDCSMCWFYCEAIEQDNTNLAPMCSDKTACFTGCDTACMFYIRMNGDTELALADIYSLSSVLIDPPAMSKINGKNYITWKRSEISKADADKLFIEELPKNEYYVYTLIGQISRKMPNAWVKISQTEQTTKYLPESLATKFSSFIVVGISDLNTVVVSKPLIVYEEDRLALVETYPPFSRLENLENSVLDEFTLMDIFREQD